MKAKLFIIILALAAGALWVFFSRVARSTGSPTPRGRESTLNAPRQDGSPQSSHLATSVQSEPTQIRAEPGDPATGTTGSTEANGIGAATRGLERLTTLPPTEAERDLLRTWLTPVNNTPERMREVAGVCVRRHLSAKEIVSLVGPPFNMGRGSITYSPAPSTLLTMQMDENGRAVKAFIGPNQIYPTQ